VQQKLPQAKAILRSGVPWREILSAVEDVAADLVVMGTHGRRGVSHALLGSVAEKIVRLSPVPVLTVRDTVG
jgi:nucleotide-binding universal stress UspA family protein